VAKAQMTRHVKGCLARKVEVEGPIAKLFHLVVEGSRLPMYWMHVEMPGADPLEELDGFLRDTWLECCYHMSGFTISGDQYLAEPPDDDFGGSRGRSMAVKLYSVLHLGTKFMHQYDFGSTTELSLKVVGVRDGPIGKLPGVALLARNDPPAWRCSTCGEPATLIRAAGWGVDRDDLFCDGCAKGGEDERYLPVANSPRTGVCGYAG
jgi:hypothetical protein